MRAHPLTLATSFIHGHRQVLTALLSVVVASGLAALADRAFARRGRRLAAAVGRGELTPVAATRLRFLRRLVSAGILLIGVLIALSQFSSLDRVATSILASGALAAAVLGFAARQTLANLVAGVMIAVTQPLRIGDLVTVEGSSGVVEDLRLNYTVVRTGQGRRLFIPNERLAGGVLANDTVIEPTVTAEVSVWIAPHADLDRALTVLGRHAAGGPVRVAEATHEGVRLIVPGGVVSPEERVARQSDLLTACLRELRQAQLLD